MRGRARVAASGVLALVAGASVVACFDLFHSTSFESACAIDAAACEDGGAATIDTAPADAGADGPTNFCDWSEPTAQAFAQRACAWLGACAGAMGDNAFGPCLLHATLAYDCTANPSLPVVGAAHAYWDCLSRAASCDDVASCVEQTYVAPISCEAPGGYLACDTPGNDPATVVACAPDDGGSAPPIGLENCAGLGQTCRQMGTTATCSGSASACKAPGTSCDGVGVLHDCDPDGGTLDFGVDCTGFGHGQCVTNGATSTCEPVGSAACAVTTDVWCDGGVATGCPSGVLEQVSCASVPGLGCDPDAGGRPWDVSRACYSGTCGPDSCSNGAVVSCVRGLNVTLDCGSQGLGPCNLVTYPGDSAPHAQCGAPDGGAL